MNIKDAVKSVIFKKYATFSGRAVDQSIGGLALLTAWFI